MRPSEELRRTYDEYYADTGEREWRRLGAIDKAQNIVRLCAHLKPRTVLEIGAGDGAVTERLAELHFGDGLYAAEISSSGVSAIKARSIPRLVDAILFDGAHLPYERSTFDLAILSHVVEHVEFPRELLYEAARVARYVFVEVPLEDTARLPADFVADRTGHINHYSPRTIRWLLQSSGLRVLAQLVTNPSREVYTYAGGRGALLNFWIKETCLRLVPRAATRWFSFHCSLLCEPAAAPQVPEGREAA